MFILSLLNAGCGQNGKAKTAGKDKPAEVKPLPQEANLADIHLTQKSAQRLGIKTARAEWRTVAKTRQVGGEIIVPPGESAILVAPIPGTVQRSADQPLPKPGTRVVEGQLIFRFEPLLTPERFVPTPAERAQIANAQASLISLQMAADGDVRQFTEQVNAAEIVLRRAEQLLRDRVGSERNVDDARAQLAIADAGLRVAVERKQVLDRLTADIEKDSVSPIDFVSPINGVVRSLPITLGQTVATGATLIEVTNLEEVWIRVPIYVGLLNQVHTSKTVSVAFMGNHEVERPLAAEPVQAPPAADPFAATVDLYYRMKNTNGRMRPGERVLVTLPTSDQVEMMTVPAQAILYDIHGGTWVYREISENSFRRQRVLVRQTSDSFAILLEGLHEGDEVVVDGAAELFGTEFGTGK